MIDNFNDWIIVIRPLKLGKYFFCKINLLFFFTFLFSTQNTQAASYFSFDENVQHALDLVLKGKTVYAQKIIEENKQTQPENLIWFWLSDYNFFTEMYLTENKNQYLSYLKSNHDAALELEESKVDNEWKAYCLSELYLHAAFAQLIFEDFRQGFWNLRKSYKTLELAEKKYPAFMPLQKNLALIGALMGSLPEKYHWLLNFFGIPPQYEQGMTQLLKYSNNEDTSFYFKQEVILVYGVLLYYTASDKNSAIQFFAQHNFPEAGNLIGSLLMGKLLLHHHQNKKAEEYLFQISLTSEYPKCPQLYYWKGICALQQLDPLSSVYFRNYILQTRSPYLIKSSYQKMAWSKLLVGDTLAYYQFIQNVQTSGTAKRDADQQALAENQSEIFPNIYLLKARLYFDAGQFEEAHKIFNNPQLRPSELENYSLEWQYREARNYHLMKEYQKALKGYKATIENGENLPQYFAANAALQMGYIYVLQNNIALAKAAFEKALSLKNHSYANSISQKAKHELSRLK